MIGYVEILVLVIVIFLIMMLYLYYQIKVLKAAYIKLTKLVVSDIVKRDELYAELFDKYSYDKRVSKLMRKVLEQNRDGM